MNHGKTKDNSFGAPDPKFLDLLLKETAARHSHLCPRQVLGVRMALCALKELELIGRDYQPRFVNADKRLLTIVETDGCGADGLAIPANCSVGHRTLRVLDFGKMAATFVDTYKKKAVRVIPTMTARKMATRIMPELDDRWHAYLQAYQVLPDSELIVVKTVHLTQSIAEIISRPNCRATCTFCGEEIMNEREIATVDGLLCRNCAGDSYYHEDQ